MANSKNSIEPVLSRACGLDVHKETVVGTISGKGITTQTKTFSTMTNSLRELGIWLQENEVRDVAMESTGVYWKPVYHILEEYDLNIKLVNARHIKNVPGRKTDKADSEWISKLLLNGLLQGSFIPAKDIRELRELSRYKKKLKEQIASEKNRIIKTLEDANIKLSSVVSDTSGVVATQLIEGLLHGRTDIENLIEENYHRKLKSSKELIKEALTGHITEHHKFMINAMQEHISYLQNQVSNIEIEMEKTLKNYEEEINLLQTIPGVGKEGAIGIISEIGADMSVFPDEHHLASWAGLCPGNNESAGKKKSSRTRQGNKYLKSLVSELAWGATRTKGTYYRAKYESMVGRRGKKRALIAIGHKILCAAYYIIRDKEPYNELGYDFLVERKTKNKIAFMTQQLKEFGYNVEKIKAA
jgi:transposase